MTRQRCLGLLEALLCFAGVALLGHIYPWKDLLAPTITAGGDTASHYYPALLMHKELLPQWQLTGWTMGNYAGFPIFHFYSTLPFFLIAALGYLFPMQETFKLVTLIGPTSLPLAAAYLFWALGYRRGGPVLAAASVLPFLFQQGNSMWGGNIPSVLAGEFCHAIGFSLSLIYLGHIHRLSKGIGSWVVNGLLLAAIGLSHAFAFIGALWFALFYLRPGRDAARTVPRIVPAFFLAALLMAFWGFPVIPRVKFTTEWTMIWHIQDWKEVAPELLWPAAALSLLNVTLMLVRLKRFILERHGLMLFTLGGSAFLYAVSPITGFPDVRFVPIGQLFLGFLAADLIVWAGSRLKNPLLFATVGMLLTLGWAYQHIGYLPSWLTWNYSGYEGKPSWPLFKAINDHVAGDINSPRMVFEHSPAHNRFGSSRAFENLPLFAGRSTLEGVFHQVSPNSPFVFYIQSEVSEKTSGPFHQYSYTRLDPQAALPHLRAYNVATIVAVSDKARAAYDANPAYQRTFSDGGYAVYQIPSANTGYVVAAANQPVMYEGPDYRTAFYRWFKHPELLDIPLVPADMLGSRTADSFSLRTSSIRDIPRVAYGGECKVDAHLEQEKISFDTTCPGRPHIVKVSYFPRWKSFDGSPIYLVSPGFMLVTPSSNHFEMSYERAALDWFALATTMVGILWTIGCATSPRLRRATTAPIARAFAIVYAPLSRHATSISVIFVIACVASGSWVRYQVSDEDADFRVGQEAFRAKQFERVTKLFGEYTRDDKDTFKQATALLQLANSQAELGHHELAVDTLERLSFDFPNIDYRANTLFLLAHSQVALGRVDEAREHARELYERFADTPWLARLKKENPELVKSVESAKPALSDSGPVTLK